MAATVGATITGVDFPQRNLNLGPFKSSAGNFYFFAPNSLASFRSNIVPMKASDPISSFTGGTEKTMASAANDFMQAVSCYQVSDVIHVATQISTGAVYYNSFNMATDAWTLTTSETAVTAPSAVIPLQHQCVDIVVRSNGEVVFIYSSAATSMGTDYGRAFYRRRTGTNTYATAVELGSAGTVNWAAGAATLGLSDRVHFSFTETNNGVGYQRTLSAANALQTLPSAWAGSINSYQSCAKGVSYVNGANTEVRLPISTGDANIWYHHFNSADVPSTANGSTGTIQVESTTQAIHCMVNDGTTLHTLYSENSTQDLMHDKASNGGAGGWGTDVNEFTGNVLGLTANVYDRSGTKLAVVLKDNGIIKYAEIDLAVVPTLTQTTFRGRNDDGSESAATWKVTAGTDWTQAVDVNFRVRFNINAATNPPTQNTVFKLRYSHNGGAYTDVTGSSSVVRSFVSSNVADAAATTEQLAGSGTFNAGTFDEVDGSATGFTASPAAGHDTEIEYCVRIMSADVVNNDTINLRIYDNSGTALNGGYTDTPIITVSEAVTTSAVWTPNPTFRRLSLR